MMWSGESYTCRESIRIFKSSELREKCLDPVLANRCCVAGRGRDEHRRIRFPETIAPIHDGIVQRVLINPDRLLFV